MGWLSELGKLVGGSGDKESLIRRLLKRRIAQDPNAHALGQTPAVADDLGTQQLMGLPEATIVTCVETWAVLSREGLSQDEIARRIAQHRGTRYPGDGVEALIRICVDAEHGNALYLPSAHVEWCIREARTAYGI